MDGLLDGVGGGGSRGQKVCWTPLPSPPPLSFAYAAKFKNTLSKLYCIENSKLEDNICIDPDETAHYEPSHLDLC